MNDNKFREGGATLEIPASLWGAVIIGLMLLLGHLGITMGATIGIERVLSRIHPADPPGALPARVAVFLRALDYRILLLGSVLPDLIDKPVGVYLFHDTFESGRIFAHTLLFLLALTAIGIWRYRRSAASGVLTLALGVFMHLLLDGVWRSPRTLFWPAFGLDFPEYETGNFLREMIERLLHKPSAYIPEFVGLAIGLGIGVRMLRSGALLRFFKTGVLYERL